MNIRKRVARAAVVCTATTVVSVLLSTGGAAADTFVPLPGGELTKTLTDGTVVHVRLDGESANINPSLGATPLHRNAWVSGSVHIELSGANSDVGGSIYPGYVVGCQVNISGGQAGGGATMDVGRSGQGVSGTPGGNTSGSLTLGPGQAQSFYLLDEEQKDDFGNEQHKTRNVFHGSGGSVSWADETIALSGCAGYAQARAFVNVEIDTPHVIGWITLWGQPFSLG